MTYMYTTIPALVTNASMNGKGLACWLMKVFGVIFCFCILVNCGVLAGYQNELTYKHKDGSYSAFGERDGSGNTWRVKRSIHGNDAVVITTFLN